MMEIETVRTLLSAVALDHSRQKPDDAIQKIALALMHMAEGIEELRVHVARLSAQRSQPS
jgi:hypothetical protein